jgi:hypothetical protein
VTGEVVLRVAVERFERLRKMLQQTLNREQCRELDELLNAYREVLEAQREAEPE